MSESVCVCRSQQDTAGERARRQQMVQEAEEKLGELQRQLSDLSDLKSDLQKVTRDNGERRRQLE